MFRFFVLLVFMISSSMPLLASDEIDSACIQMQQYILSSMPMSRVFAVYLASDHALSETSQDEQDKYARAFETMANTSLDPKDMLETCQKNLRSRARKLLSAISLKAEGPTFLATNLAQGRVVGDSLLNGVVAEYKEQKVTHAVEHSNRLHCADSAINEGSCLISAGLFTTPTGLDQFISYELKKNMKPPVRYSDADCECLIQEMKSKNSDIRVVTGHVAEIEKQLEKPIAEAVGKKFLNDYASYVEDIGYFATNQATTLAEKYGKDYDRAILCQDPKVFEQAIDETCAKNGTTTGKEERLTALMGSFGDKFNFSNGHFGEGFKSLVDDINTYTVDSKKVTGGKPNILTRRAYDEARYGLGRSKPQVDLANDIITFIARDKDALKYVEEQISHGKTPLFGILSLISGHTDKDKAGDILKKLAGKNRNQSDEIKELIKKLGTPESSAWSNRLFHVALNLNPGLKQIMTSPQLFSDSVKLVKKGNLRILRSMVSDRETFTGYNKKRCQGLVNNLAEAVCTKKEDLKSAVDTKELISLLQNKKIITQQPNDYLDLTICMSRNNFVETGSAFDGIDLESSNPYTQSDYLDRKSHAPEDQSNGLANLAKHSADPAFAQQISQSTHMFDNERVGIPGFTSGSDTDARHMSFKKEPSAEAPSSSQSNQVADTKSSFQPIQEAAVQAPVAKEFAPVASMAPQVSSPAAAASVAPVAQAQVEEAKEAPKTAHEKLSKVLANSENKSSVSSLMSSIDNKDAEEILRLNEQARKDKEEITELKLDEERRKTASMKSELESAQQKLFQLEHPASGGTTGSVSGQVAHLDPAHPSFSTNTLSSPGQTSGSSGLGGTPNVTGGAALGNIREVAGGSAAVALRDATPDAPEAMSLVISSNKGDGKTRVIDDPNNELINFLTKNEPTVKQLQELKTAGLLYTVEDVSKDGVKIQTKKLIRYQELSVAAKALIEKKLASISVIEAKRNYSIQALKFELLSMNSKRSKKI